MIHRTPQLPVRFHRNAGRVERGFSLIELMISVVIGLIILAALLALFVDISRSNRELAKTNIQIENGRFAIQILQEDLMHAGFWGTYVPQFDDLTFDRAAPTTTPNAVPDPCQNAATWTPLIVNDLIGIPVQATDTVPTCGGIITNQQPNTDILIVRHAETCVQGANLNDGTLCTGGAGDIYFQSSLVPDPEPAGCAPEPARYVLGTQPQMILRNRQCTGLAPVRRFVSNIYYVRDFSNTLNDGIPALVRSSFVGTTHQAPQLLVEGIEGFVVELGFDNVSITGAPVNLNAQVNWVDPINKTMPANRGDGVAENYIRCTAATCTAANLPNAVSAQIHVLARNLELTPGHAELKTYTLGTQQLGPFNDQIPRHVFTSAVRFNNSSGRRQLP